MKLKDIRCLIGAFSIIITKTRKGSAKFVSTKITLHDLKNYDDFLVLKICPVDASTFEIYLDVTDIPY